MRLLIFCLMFVSATALFGQSKKELQAQVTALKAEVAELKKPKETPLDTTNIHDKASYGLGVLVGGNLKQQGGDSLNVELIAQALKDVFGDKTPKIDQQQAMATVQQYMQRAMEAKTAVARKAGEDFLATNKTKEGVKTTASGLQYKVLTAGKGKTPTAADRVTVHYTGKLIDGTVFDSSVERGEPATFGVNEVISGWTEVLQLMHEGDKWEVYIPQDLGYGERGAGGQIPPYSTLVFQVELIKVN